MLSVKDNFTDSTTLLKRERRRRVEQDCEPDERLENRLWVFLHDIGFSKMNIGRECEVRFGKDGKNLDSKKVDIVAESNHARIYVECSTQVTSGSKIKDWISDVSLIRRYEKVETKNIGYVFFTDQEINGKDLSKLEQSGIKALSEKMLDYLSELIKSYKNLAYYQFLGNLFAGQKIASIPEEDFIIPAIRCKYTKREYCYLFGIQPAKLIPLASVLHRKIDAKSFVSSQLEKSVSTYQRLVKKEKINSIKEYIRDKGGVFPTNIIVSLEPVGSFFRPISSKKSDIHFGNLELPHCYQAVTVIDGQHRLFAYDGLEEANNRLIYVVAFARMDIDEQMKTFVNINVNQTKVSPSLMWDLYPSILIESDFRARISNIAKDLNTKDPDSSLFGVIGYDSAPYSGQTRITLESICTALKTNKILDKIESLIKLHDLARATDGEIYKILLGYFNAIRDLASEHWNGNDKTLNVLCSNQGIGALILLLVEVLRYEKLKKDDVETLKLEFSRLLTPAVEKVKLLKSKEEIKEFKRVGEKGKKQMFVSFAKEINKEFPDFCPDLVAEEGSQAIDELVEKLKKNDEHLDVEAKEAFFTDTKSLKATGQLFENKDEALRGIIKTVAAFANLFGGDIIVGLEDKTYRNVGLDDTDIKIKKDWDTLKSAMSQKIATELDGIVMQPEIVRYIKDSKMVAVIKVRSVGKKALEKQHLVCLKHDGLAYTRQNGSSIPIKTNLISSYCDDVLKLLNEKELQEEEVVT